MPKKGKNRGNKKNKDIVAELKQLDDRNHEVRISENEIVDVTPAELKNLIKTNSIKLDSIKSKQEIVINAIESVQDVILMKDQVTTVTPNPPDLGTPDLEKNLLEYKKSQADLSHRLNIMNHKLTQKESLVKSLNTQITSLKQELYVKSQKYAKNEIIMAKLLKNVKDGKAQVQNFSFRALIITLILVILFFGIKPVVFMITAYFLIKYFSQN